MNRYGCIFYAGCFHETTNCDGRSPYAEERSNQEYAQGNKEKHSLMRPIVIELKLDLKCLNKGKRHAIKMYFVEVKMAEELSSGAISR